MTHVLSLARIVEGIPNGNLLDDAYDHVCSLLGGSGGGNGGNGDGVDGHGGDESESPSWVYTQLQDLSTEERETLVSVSRQEVLKKKPKLERLVALLFDQDLSHREAAAVLAKNRRNVDRGANRFTGLMRAEIMRRLVIGIWTLIFALASVLAILLSPAPTPVRVADDGIAADVVQGVETTEERFVYVQHDNGTVSIMVVREDRDTIVSISNIDPEAGTGSGLQYEHQPQRTIVVWSDGHGTGTSTELGYVPWFAKTQANPIVPLTNDNLFAEMRLTDANDCNGDGTVCGSGTSIITMAIGPKDGIPWVAIAMSELAAEGDALPSSVHTHTNEGIGSQNSPTATVTVARLSVNCDASNLVPDDTNHAADLHDDANQLLGNETPNGIAIPRRCRLVGLDVSTSTATNPVPDVSR